MYAVPCFCVRSRSLRHPAPRQRDATYKLATLMALIDYCIENLPDHPEGLAVPSITYFRGHWWANLVLACTKCNGDKSGALPAIEIVDRVLERDAAVLEEIARSI